jgi:hypothetical protein
VTEAADVVVKNTNIRIRVSGSGSVDVWVHDFDDPSGRVVASSSAGGVSAVEKSIATIVGALLDRQIGKIQWEVIEEDPRPAASTTPAER